MWSRLPFGDELRSGLGTPRRARRLGSSPRSRVWRAELSGTPVVVKQLIDAPEAAERYAREVAAPRIASQADPPVVPMLLGTDPDEPVLFLEHSDHQPPREGWARASATAPAKAVKAPARSLAHDVTSDHQPRVATGMGEPRRSS